MDEWERNGFLGGQVCWVEVTRQMVQCPMTNFRAFISGFT